MFRKINLVSATLALMTMVFMCALANAQTPQAKPTPRTIVIMPPDYPSGSHAVSAPTPTPKPQNQSVLNTTKSNTKDLAVPGTTSPKGWDGVQGRQITTQVDLKFDSAKDFDNFAAGRLPINFILKNTASGQTLTLASKLLTENFKPSQDKSMVTVWLVIDNLTAPIWDAQGCVQTLTNAENTPDGANITISYAACGSMPATVQNRPGNPISGIVVSDGKKGNAQNSVGGPVKGVKVGLGKNPPGGILFVMPGGSEVSENAEAALKLKINPSSNGVKRTAANNVIVISSSKGSGSNKVQNF